ncbi:MAG: DUF3592 domain-containing protein [Anaerolineae bacterium]
MGLTTDWSIVLSAIAWALLLLTGLGFLATGLESLTQQGKPVSVPEPHPTDDLALFTLERPPLHERTQAQWRAMPFVWLIITLAAALALLSLTVLVVAFVSLCGGWVQREALITGLSVQARGGRFAAVVRYDYEGGAGGPAVVERGVQAGPLEDRYAEGQPLRVYVFEDAPQYSSVRLGLVPRLIGEALGPSIAVRARLPFVLVSGIVLVAGIVGGVLHGRSELAVARIPHRPAEAAPAAAFAAHLEPVPGTHPLVWTWRRVSGGGIRGVRYGLHIPENPTVYGVLEVIEPRIRAVIGGQELYAEFTSSMTDPQQPNANPRLVIARPTELRTVDLRSGQTVLAVFVFETDQPGFRFSLPDGTQLVGESRRITQGHGLFRVSIWLATDKEGHIHINPDVPAEYHNILAFMAFLLPYLG